MIKRHEDKIIAVLIAAIVLGWIFAVSAGWM